MHQHTVKLVFCAPVEHDFLEAGLPMRPHRAKCLMNCCKYLFLYSAIGLLHQVGLGGDCVVSINTYAYSYVYPGIDFYGLFV